MREEGMSPAELVCGYVQRGKKVAQLESDLAAAREEIERLNSKLQKSVPYDTQKAMDQVCEDNERLREALRRYGDHRPDCQQAEHPDLPCDCGLAALLESDNAIPAH